MGRSRGGVQGKVQGKVQDRRRAGVGKRQSGARSARRMITVLAATVTVTGLAFSLAPAAGRHDPGDQVLTVGADADPFGPAPTGPVRATSSPRTRTATTTSGTTGATTATSGAGRAGVTAAAGRTTTSPGVAGSGSAIPAATVGGWYAGASGLGVTSGAFATWLGQPVTVSAAWDDQSITAQRNLSSLSSEFGAWPGALDLAVGGTVLAGSENYASAASGAYDARWKAAAATLAARRGSARQPTFVRLFHEMNGNWYGTWMVTQSNQADYKAAWARYVAILRAAMPGVYISWSPNYTDHTGLPVTSWYPGDAVVDCVAPDYYDDGSSPARLSVTAWNTESTATDSLGNPAGPESWRRFALKHGKPLCFPEWGLKPEGSGVDHPEWIRAVNAWMNKFANTATWRLGQPIPRAAAGKVLYSVYFNVVHQGNPGFTIYGGGANPQSSALFPTLRWGNRR